MLRQGGFETRPYKSPDLCAVNLAAALLERRYLKVIRSVRLSVEALGLKGSFVAFALF